MRDETSVHMAIGNLNPPPTTEIVQDYSTPDGDLEVVFFTEPGRPPTIAGRRVDGEVYVSVDGTQFEHVSAQKMSEAEETPFIAMFRTDALKDLTSLFAAARTSELIDGDRSLGPGVVGYRLEVETAAWYAAQESDRALGVPRNSGLPTVMPASLWVGSTGLPVRLEVKYSEPLNGIEGTGTVRVDYSQWSEPVSVKRP